MSCPFELKQEGTSFIFLYFFPEVVYPDYSRQEIVSQGTSGLLSDSGDGQVTHQKEQGTDSPWLLLNIGCLDKVGAASESLTLGIFQSDL